MSDINAVVTEFDKLKAKNKQLSESNAMHEQQSKILAKQLDSLEERITASQGRLEALLLKVEESSSELKGVEKNISEKKSELVALEKSVELASESVSSAILEEERLIQESINECKEVSSKIKKEVIALEDSRTKLQRYFSKLGVHINE